MLRPDRGKRKRIELRSSKRNTQQVLEEVQEAVEEKRRFDERFAKIVCIQKTIRGMSRRYTECLLH